MANTTKTILVIGGTGMLGKAVAQQLKADVFNVRLLARNPDKAQKLLRAGNEIVKGDTCRARFFTAPRVETTDAAGEGAVCDGVYLLTIHVQGEPAVAAVRADAIGGVVLRDQIGMIPLIVVG